MSLDVFMIVSSSSLVEEIWANPQLDQSFTAALRQVYHPTDQSALAYHLALLPYFFCEMHGGSYEQALPIVTAWNLLRHSARLLDNIEDGHHIVTQDQMAVDLNLSTGLLFTVGLVLDSLETYGVSSAAARDVRRTFYFALLQTCAGQHVDLSNSSPSLEDSWQIAAAKSGIGTGAVCWAGGRIVCSDQDTLVQYRQFGYNLGLLDQIHDDLADLAVTETGQSDLRAAVRHTLPIAYALTVLPGAQRDQLRYLLQTSHAELAQEALARQLIIKSGAALYLMTQAKLYHQQATNLLKTMYASHETKSKLQQLLDKFVLF
ncbi:MAG: polyprenyl synthetase family protein [Chloroflexi bacterium]|nr:polyprenyl synthetase family protein [Chloroflexota bacterium]